jgi:hypothetical protein
MSARRLLWATVAVSCLIGVALPSAAGAFASVGPVPVAGSPGLPDGRVYEQASPPNKNGNAAGVPGAKEEPPAMLAEAGGEGVAYNNNIASIGNTKSGAQFFTVAKRASEGWVNDGAFPLTIGEPAALLLSPEEIGFSADLTKVYFRSQDYYLPEVPVRAALLYDIANGSTTWLDPPPASTEKNGGAAARVAGFSGDMSIFYFRTQAGFYEYHDGVVSVAGVLPDGSVEPGALAAGLLLEGGSFQGSELRNQVSEDGADAFFVSSAGELYVRHTAADGTQSTALVSRDMLLEPVAGLPAPAPHGVLTIKFPREGWEGEALSSPPYYPSSSTGDLYASPDGSRAFFASEDRLTSAAPGGGGMYELNTLTDSLTYLPGVGVSPILVSSRDGSRFIFNGPGGLSLWSEAGPSGGTVTPIEPFPVLGEARATPDGSVFVFESAAPLAGFNNGGSHQEIYRYDVVEGSLTCVSCPPAGIVPSGNAYMSHDVPDGVSGNGAPLMFSNRGVSTDGSRVFFDSPDPLVPQVTNTRPLGRNVYEWENGRLFLISTGTSGRSDYVGDESANGNDVFFSTTQGLAPGDTDEAYDVYDARVPRPGDHPPPPPAACEGDVCQGPPSVPVLLPAPASATFSGLGNPAPPVATPTAVVKPTPKAKGCKKGFTKKKNKCVKNKKSKRAKKASNKQGAKR